MRLWFPPEESERYKGYSFLPEMCERNAAQVSWVVVDEVVFIRAKNNVPEAFSGDVLVSKTS